MRPRRATRIGRPYLWLSCLAAAFCLAGCEKKSGQAGSTPPPLPGSVETLAQLTETLPVTTSMADLQIGYVDFAKREGAQLKVEGWAIDWVTKGPSSRVWVIADGRVLGRIVPGLDRADVAGAHNDPRFQRSGFSATLEVAGLAPQAALQLYAEVSGGKQLALIPGLEAKAPPSAGAPAATPQARPADVPMATRMAKAEFFKKFEALPSADSPAGYVDTTDAPRNGLPGDGRLISGWAIDLVARTPALEVWVVVGDAAYGRAAVEGSRDDVAKALNDPTLVKTGWTLQVPGDAFAAGAPIEGWAVLRDGKHVAKLGGPSAPAAK